MVLLRTARTAYATLASAPLRLSFRRRFAVRSAPSGRTGSLSGVALLQTKKSQGFTASKFSKHNYDVFIQVF